MSHQKVLEKPLIKYINDGTKVEDADIKRFALWAIACGHVEERKGKSGWFPKMGACHAEAGGCKEKHLKVTTLIGRIDSQIQVLGRVRSPSQGGDKEERTRTFSQTGFEEENDDGSTLKSKRVDSPPKA